MDNAMYRMSFAMEEYALLYLKKHGGGLFPPGGLFQGKKMSES
jgi:hypothetical protein